MAIAPPTSISPSRTTAPSRGSLQVPESIWRAPLVPAALAVTAGIVLDRYSSIPWPASLVALLAALSAWLATRGGREPALSLIYLGGAIAALAALYHHWYRDFYPPDDIGEYATLEPRPVKVRGFIAEEPSISLQPKGDKLLSFQR